MSTTLKAERCLYQSKNFSELSAVRKIQREFGCKGFALLTVILNKICESCDDVRDGRLFRELVAAALPDVSPNLVKMVARRMTEVGLLDRQAFKDRGILTPPKEYVISDRQFTADGVGERPYCFICFGDYAVSPEGKVIYSEQNVISSEEIDIVSEEKRDDTEIIQNNSDLLRNNTEYIGNNTEISRNK